MTELMRADIVVQAGRPAPLRGAGEHGFPAVGRDRQPDLAEPQRSGLLGRAAAVQDEETAALVGCDRIEPQRYMPAVLACDCDTVVADAAGDACSHALGAAPCPELVDGDRTLDLDVAAQPAEQRGRDANAPALVPLRQRGRETDRDLLVAVGTRADRLLD